MANTERSGDFIEGLSHFEALAVTCQQRRERRLQRLYLLAVVTAAFVGVAWVVRSERAWAAVGLSALATLAGWAWHAVKERGVEGRTVRAWDVVLRAETWHDAANGLVEAFVWHHPRLRFAVDVDAARADIDDLRAMFTNLDVPPGEPVGRALVERLVAELELRAAEARRLAAQVDIGEREREVDRKRALVEDYARLVREDAREEADRILREAMEDAADVRSGKRPRHAWWLRPTAGDGPGPSPKALAFLFEQAARDAGEGRVTESPAAAAVLEATGRWQAYEPPVHVCEALLALFDPTCAAFPPGTSGAPSVVPSARSSDGSREPPPDGER